MDEITLDLAELRAVTRYAASCARRVLPIFEAICPADSRPRDAIDAADAFAAGGKRTVSLRVAAWAAFAAARELGDSPAGHAARAASHAAAAAFLHPISSPHQVKHILGAAVHQAIAIEQSRPDAGEAAVAWAASIADDTIRDVLRRYPPPSDRGAGRFAECLRDLDARLRH